ncbi:hypothetical protein [Microvirga lenta]|uniref:hypothetical protein n=1 Tax=Microvirga lenta TaxID=2881337 RepID=UPI001CFE392B|nr:hypothetical protein [Microvirga lenta]MCB5173647.1 hypothetical protein [Microvirga lenta]
MKRVRFTRDFDHWPTASILTVFKKGEERKITEAQYEAANAAGAVELIDGEGEEQGQAASEVGGSASESTSDNRTGNRSRRR